jgi:hypothetical protein
MLKCYLNFQELYYHYPRIEEWVDNSHVTQILNSATNIVASDLRNKSVDTQRLYIPKMFDGTDFGEPLTVTDTYSVSVPIVNERRFVIEVTSTTGCYIEVEGSVDNTHFSVVAMLDGTDAGIQIDEAGMYTRSFIEGYKYIRYSITGSATMYAYCVDTSLDQLIITKALALICLPLLGNDGLAEALYAQALPMYQSLLSGVIYDYDRAGDGSINDDDRDVTVRRRVGR